MYRHGHNHGLMVDLALLNLAKEFPEYRRNIDFDLVTNRSSRTVDAMWHSSGLTKEHSVSYQEYNIPLTVEYFESINDLGLATASVVNLENILGASKKLLGYALKSNGEYFPLGDSFRFPNAKILNKIFGENGMHESSPHHLLLPYSGEEGFYISDHFYIYRNTVSGRKVHFAATCCWDSHNHKQNDELSFCLEVDGVTIFDDPGYTEFSDWGTIEELKKEDVHSTLTILGESWSDKKEPNGKSYLSAREMEDGFSLLMVAERVAGITFEREIILKGKALIINDNIAHSSASQERVETQVKSRFVLSKGVKAALPGNEDGVIPLCKDDLPLAYLRHSSCLRPFEEGVPFVCADRKKIVTTSSLVFEGKLKSKKFNYKVYWG